MSVVAIPSSLKQSCCRCRWRRALLLLGTRRCGAPSLRDERSDLFVRDLAWHFVRCNAIPSRPSSVMSAAIQRSERMWRYVFMISMSSGVAEYTAATLRRVSAVKGLPYRSSGRCIPRESCPKIDSDHQPLRVIVERAARRRPCRLNADGVVVVMSGRVVGCLYAGVKRVVAVMRIVGLIRRTHWNERRSLTPRSE